MTSRGEFIQKTVGAGLAMGVSACASDQGAAVKPGRREIVDAQVHLWKASSPDLPWVPGATPQMPEPFTIEKALPLMDEAGGDRVVIGTPAPLGHRNDYSLEAARPHPRRF